MPQWTQDTAIEEIGELVEEVQALSQSGPYSVTHTHWLMTMTRFLEEVFGEASLYYVNFVNISWRFSGPVALTWQEAFNPVLSRARHDRPVFLQGLQRAAGLLLAAKDELARKGMDGVYQGKDTGPEASTILKVLSLAEVKLRKALRRKPEREKEVQDAFESLLLGAGISYSREMVSIEYSSKKYIPDFTIDRADLAVELKFSDDVRHEKELIPQINDDILAYRTQYGNIVFIVYDCGFIRDVERFVESFEIQGAVYVRVVKH